MSSFLSDTLQFLFGEDEPIGNLTPVGRNHTTGHRDQPSRTPSPTAEAESPEILHSVELPGSFPFAAPSPPAISTAESPEPETEADTTLRVSPTVAVAARNPRSHTAAQWQAARDEELDNWSPSTIDSHSSPASSPILSSILGPSPSPSPTLSSASSSSSSSPPPTRQHSMDVTVARREYQELINRMAALGLTAQQIAEATGVETPTRGVVQHENNPGRRGHALLPKDLRLGTEKYGGTAQEDLVEWCRSISAELRLCGTWTDAEKCHAAFMRLEGAARLWYLDRMDAAEHDTTMAIGNWLQFRTAIQERFQPLLGEGDIMVEVAKTRQGTKTIAEYTREMLALYGKIATARMPFTWKKAMYINGLYDRDLKAELHMRNDFNTIEEMAAHATYYTHIAGQFRRQDRQSQRQQYQPFQRQQAYQQQRLPQQQERNYGVAPMELGALRCHNCRKPGHFMRECPQPRLCHNCNQPGHIARNCRQQGAAAAGQGRQQPGRQQQQRSQPRVNNVEVAEGAETEEEDAAEDFAHGQ